MDKILLVEDEANIRKLVSINLSARGYEVIEANDAETGYEILLSDHAEALILDIMLPGMSGWDLLEMMADEPSIKSIPVVVLTGSIVHDQAESSSYKNIYQVLSKPVNVKELMSTIQQAITVN